MECTGSKIGCQGLLYRMVVGSKKATPETGGLQQPIFGDALGPNSQSGLAGFGAKYCTVNHRLGATLYPSVISLGDLCR